MAGQAPLVLSRARTAASSDRLIYGYWNGAADPAAIVVRERMLDTGYRERVTVQSFREPVTMRVEVQCVADNSPVYQLHQTLVGDGGARAAESKLWASRRGCVGHHGSGGNAGEAG